MNYDGTDKYNITKNGLPYLDLYYDYSSNIVRPQIFLKVLFATS